MGGQHTYKKAAAAAVLTAVGSSGSAPIRAQCEPLAFPPFPRLLPMMNVPGGGYKNAASKSAIDCRAACCADPSCFAFTWAERAGSNGTCKEHTCMHGDSCCFFKDATYRNPEQWFGQFGGVSGIIGSEPTSSPQTTSIANYYTQERAQKRQQLGALKAELWYAAEAKKQEFALAQKKKAKALYAKKHFAEEQQKKAKADTGGLVASSAATSRPRLRRSSHATSGSRQRSRSSSKNSRPVLPVRQFMARAVVWTPAPTPPPSLELTAPRVKAIAANDSGDLYGLLCGRDTYAAPDKPADPALPGALKLKGQFVCTTCPSGKLQPKKNQLKCASCSAGKYQTTVILGKFFSCVQCPLGKYSAPGASVCASCPTGQFQPNAHWVNLQEKSIRAHSRPGRDLCVDQEAYVHTLIRQLGSHLDTFLSQLADTSAPGKDHRPADKRTHTTTNRTRSTTNHTRSATVAHKAVRPLNSSCTAGHFGNTTVFKEMNNGNRMFWWHAECERCPLGKYQEQADSFECKECPTGKFQPTPRNRKQLEFCVSDGSITTAAPTPWRAPIPRTAAPTPYATDLAEIKELMWADPGLTFAQAEEDEQHPVVPPTPIPTAHPTRSPTVTPTTAPTRYPTSFPTGVPTTGAPTPIPTSHLLGVYMSRGYNFDGLVEVAGRTPEMATKGEAIQKLVMTMYKERERKHKRPNYLQEAMRKRRIMKKFLQLFIEASVVLPDRPNPEDPVNQYGAQFAIQKEGG
jgi:hypothetical protein